MSADQRVDARALASSIRLAKLTGSRWAAFTAVRENPLYRPKYRSSYSEPRIFVFGEVKSCGQVTSVQAHFGPCDGKGVISPERRARARLQAGIDKEAAP